MYLSLAAVLLVSVCTCGGEEELKDLHLMGLFNIVGTTFISGDATLMAANMALEHINNRSDVLGGYRLVLHVNDTHVSTFISTTCH